MVLSFQAIFNFLIPDHDANVFLPPTAAKRRLSDVFVDFLLSGFRRWDGVYFMHIAEHGYTYQNTLAFFPLFPMAVRTLANTLLYPLQGVLSYHSVLLLSSTILNTVVFVQSAKVLHKLALCLLKDQTLAFQAVQLYCVNPASIFFSAAYSETLYALCTFSGMLKLEEDHLVSSAVCFALSGATRSNGLVNFGFIVYRKARDVAQKCSKAKDVAQKWCQTTSAPTPLLQVSLLLKLSIIILKATATTLPLLGIVCLPFALYQYYAYQVFCDSTASAQDLPAHIINYGRQQNYTMPYMDAGSWCRDKIPFSYSYIQKHHWDVGFLEYYQYKQLPNFLLAAPMVLICVACAVSYFRRMPWFCVTLGILSASSTVSDEYKKTDETKDTIGDPKAKLKFSDPRLYPYIVHTTFLCVFGMLCMHVQVGHSL